MLGRFTRICRVFSSCYKQYAAARFLFKDCTKMKLALIFMSVFVAISHQQYYYRNPRMMFAFPWLALPFSNQPAFYNDYDAVNGDAYYPLENNPDKIFNYVEEDEEFADIQSRVKGISRYRPRPSFQDQQNARFLFNLFASTTGTFNNPLLKTATFTLTQTLTLAKIVSCVPANNFLGNGVPAPAACRRKRNYESDDDAEENQFSIVPSETIGLMPTVLPSFHERGLNLLSSSKDDEMTASDHYSRDKRFFINKNQFIVSSTLTTYAFVNTTVTVTVNLLPPADVAAAACLAAGPPVVGPPAQVVCVACLPAGFVVCPAAAG